MTLPTLNTTKLETVEYFAYADMIASLPEAEAAALGAAVTQIGDAHILMVKNINRMLFNRAIGVGADAPVTKDAITEVTAYLQANAAPNHAVQLVSDAVTPDVVNWLTDAGLPYTNSWIKVWRDASPVTMPDTTLTVRQVGQDAIEDFATIARIAFPWYSQSSALITGPIGRDGWHHYLAYDGDTPIAGAGLYMRDGFGWLGFGGTVPTHRRRGAQSVLIAQRLQDGIAAGVHTFVTETADDTPDDPNPSTHNLLRAGFQAAYHRANYEKLAADS